MVPADAEVADDREGYAIGAMAKVFIGEILFDAVFRTMQVMGVNALDRSHPVEKDLRESVVFPLYDASNIGMQMRKNLHHRGQRRYHLRGC
jgi:alkylation response protein AidB-like acyl-CoA dehydrogenase